MQLAFSLIMSVIERYRRTTADGLEDEDEEAARTTDGGPLLLVDDDEDIRVLLGDFLCSAGYEIIEACDGADALATLRACSRRPIAIVTDLAMPRLDGWSFIKAIRDDDRFAAIPIVVVSASACPPPGLRCLCKPLERKQLIDALAGLGAPPGAGPPTVHRRRPGGGSSGD